MNRFLGPLLLLSLAVSAHAQFWEKKPYQKWSKKDCMFVLRQSPWVARTEMPPLGHLATTSAENFNPTPGWRRETQTVQSSQGPQTVTQTTVGGPPQMTSPGGSHRVMVMAQIRSALPMRHALARLRQIEARYDRKSTEEKAAFDASLHELLAEPAEDVVVLLTAHYVVALDREHQVGTVSLGLSEEQWRQNTVLVSTGFGEARPSRIEDGEEGVLLYFPRALEGKDWINASAGLRLEVDVPGRGGQTGRNIVLKFAPKKMRLAGNISY